MQKMEELLKDAFAELAKEEYENRPEEIPKHRFSLRFKLKMGWMMFMYRTGWKNRTLESHGSILDLYRPVRSKRRLLLLVALLVILLGGTVVAAESLIRWLHEVVLEQHDDHLEIYKPQSKESENTPRTGVGAEDFRKYELTEIPDGYQLVEEQTRYLFKENQVTYKDLEGHALLFRQCGDDDGNIGNVTSVGNHMEEVSVNGFIGYFVQDGAIGNLILSDGETLVELSGSISKKELLDLAEKLKAKS